MKQLLLSFTLFISFFSYAQMKEGRIVYERTMQMPTRIMQGNTELQQQQLPRTRSDQFELLFANNQTLWQFLPNAADEGGNEVSGGGMVIRFGGMNDIIYHNLGTGIRVDQRDVMDKSFVVTDSIRKLNWKLTDETKTILIYTARKATTTNIRMRSFASMENGVMKTEMRPDTVQVVAWFTTDIPVSVGPDFQGQLPGVILELDVNRGQQVYKAIEVSPKVNPSKIKEPKEGKKVTAEEFTKEREKMMEEMRKNMPPGSSFQIRQ